MRVMFVDDETQILKGITRMLACADVEWEVMTATNGLAALELLAEEPVNVLISEMKMPGMDGAELLEEVSQRYPDTVRIVLSGQAGKEAVYRAIAPMHQYLSKPCDADVLRETISRACALRQLLDSMKSHEFLGRISSLPSVPSLYQEVVAEIESEQGTVARVGEIVAQDPAMTAKILQLANSAIFGLRSKTTSAVQAASFIGLDVLKSLVLSLEVFRSFEGTTATSLNIEAFTSHCLRVASIGRTIAKCEGLDRNDSGEVFTAGLLHDVGKLILAANAPDRFSAAINKSNADSIPIVVAEKELFGLGHDEIGGYLLALWGLPQSIVEGVAFHHRSDDCCGTTLTTSAVVYLANFLANDEQSRNTEIQQSRCDELLSRLFLCDRLDTWRAAIEAETE